jgi:DNA-3-methyladenine glycosylase II
MTNKQHLLDFFASKDQKIHTLVEQWDELSIPSPASPFESLVSAIISQQLSVKAAATIHKRLVEMLDMDVTPINVLQHSLEDFRSVGVSKQKGSYLLDLAKHFNDSPKVYNALETLSDEEVIAQLTAIKGIGVWTAQMFLMFNLLREDVFPVDDLGIRNGMIKLYDLPKDTSKKELKALAERWTPHRTVACRYVWKWYGEL